MLRILLPLSSVLAACTPSPQKAAMPSPSPGSANPVQASNKSGPAGDRSSAPDPSGQGARGPLADSPAEAHGRRILSTAFVRVGPDGHLTVELRGGRVLVLRNVVMRPSDYCGMQVAGSPARAKYCGGYAEVAAARPGGMPAPDQPGYVAPDTVEPAPGPAGRK